MTLKTVAYARTTLAAALLAVTCTLAAAGPVRTVGPILFPDRDTLVVAD